MISLSNLPSGSIVRIVSIEGGHGLVQKLSLMGLSEEKIIRVISSGPGPVVVQVERNTVAVGKEMAQRIMVMRV